MLTLDSLSRSGSEGDRQRPSGWARAIGSEKPGIPNNGIPVTKVQASQSSPSCLSPYILKSSVMRTTDHS